MEFDARSKQTLVGVHKDLVAVAQQAYDATEGAFLVIHGLRTKVEEAALVAKGASTTRHSRHLPNADGWGCAIDVAALVSGHVAWNPALYKPLAEAFKIAAHNLNIPIEWGGDWKTFKDLGHFQLPWATYP